MIVSVRPTVAFVNVGHTYAHLFMLLYPTVVLALEGTWGLGYAELLPLGVAGYFLFGIGALPAGWLADRWSSARLMVLFFLGTGSASVLTGLALGPWTLALGLTLIGLFASIYHPVAIAWLVGADDRPGRTLGINGIYGAAGISGAALIAGFLADMISWRAAFIIPGGLCLLTGAWFTLRLIAGKVTMERRSYRQDKRRASADEARRGLFMLLGAILFTGLIFQMTSVAMPKLFQARLGDVIGSGALAAGTLVSIVYAFSALGQYVGGLLADRYDERWTYPLGYAAQVLVLAVALVTHSVWLVVVVSLAVALQNGTATVENCLIARYTPAAWRATMYGMKFVLALGLSSVGVPLVALIYGSSGSFDGVFWALIACAAIVMAIGMALPRTASPAAGPAIQPAE
ncbi:MAG TPA: MFS transporter [Geminicoccaceae bacterium]|nr:MFS transporter [Geminicoccaceae bacterium]